MGQTSMSARWVAGCIEAPPYLMRIRPEIRVMTQDITPATGSHTVPLRFALRTS